MSVARGSDRNASSDAVEGNAMKIAVVIVRVLMGLVFAFAGVMKFMPMQPGQIPPGDAGAMAGLMISRTSG